MDVERQERCGCQRRLRQPAVVHAVARHRERGLLPAARRRQRPRPRAHRHARRRFLLRRKARRGVARGLGRARRARVPHQQHVPAGPVPPAQDGVRRRRAAVPGAAHPPRSAPRRAGGFSRARAARPPCREPRRRQRCLARPVQGLADALCESRHHDTGVGQLAALEGGELRLRGRERRLAGPAPAQAAHVALRRGARRQRGARRRTRPRRRGRMRAGARLR